MWIQEGGKITDHGTKQMFVFVSANESKEIVFLFYLTANWTYTLGNWDKYILKPFGQIHQHFCLLWMGDGGNCVPKNTFFKKQARKAWRCDIYPSLTDPLTKYLSIWANTLALLSCSFWLWQFSYSLHNGTETISSMHQHIYRRYKNVPGVQK